jgi:hypothetical protein
MLVKQRTKCNRCRLARRRQLYAEHKERVNAQRRQRLALIAEQVRQADIRARRRSDPWGNNHAIVPLELVDGWLDQMYLEQDNSWVRVGHLIGVSDRRLRTLRFREVDKRGVAQERITVDLAEKIARAADRMDEMRDFLVPGIEGWSKGHRHCQRCGRYDVPHHAKDYCKRCYQNRQYHLSRGQEQPSPKAERWSTWHKACVRCGKTTFKHQGRGVCAGCYQQARKERSATAWH